MTPKTKEEIQKEEDQAYAEKEAAEKAEKEYQEACKRQFADIAVNYPDPLLDD